VDNDGSLRLSVREFQVAGPATEMALRPYIRGPIKQGRIQGGPGGHGPGPPPVEAATKIIILFVCSI